MQANDATSADTPPTKEDQWPPEGRWLSGQKREYPSFHCSDCNYSFDDIELYGSSIADECPKCGSSNITKLAEESDTANAGATSDDTAVLPPLE